MTVKDLIGLKILAVRYQYNPENSLGLQELHVYFHLSNGSIVQLPIWPSERFYEDLSEINGLLHAFNRGDEFEEAFREKIENQEIVDIHFQEENGLFSKPSVFQLSNEYYLTEEIYASKAFAVSLKLMDKKEFLARKGLRSFCRDFKENYD